MRWCVAMRWPNGVTALYTVADEAKAKELASNTKQAYKQTRVFVGYEVELSQKPPTEDI